MNEDLNGERLLLARQRDALDLIRERHPELTIKSFTVASGQFNDVMIVNDYLAFRFPRTDDAAAVLAIEIAVLRALQGRLPVAVPAPTFTAFTGDDRRPTYMGYRLLPGRPLSRESLDDLRR
ncbi:MAG: hypothetical protein WEC79_01720 [Thermomicrobiales bacterium]